MIFVNLLIFLAVVGGSWWLVRGLIRGIRNPKPCRPKTTVWNAGWSNPLPNLHYDEQMEEYERLMERWRANRR
jgi:hypothetical protein